MGVRRCCFALGATIQAIAGITEAAEPPSREQARLVYRVDPALGARCPDDAAVRALVAARLGYDPFVTERVPRTVELRVHQHGGGLQGHVTITDGRTAPAVREMASPSADCEGLVASLAVTIAVGIDPLSLAPPPATKSEPLEPEPPSKSEWPPDSDEKRPPQPAPPPPSAQLEVHAGPIVAVGAAPAPSLGVTVGAGPRWRSMSIGIEGRVDFPASTPGELGGEVSSSLLLGNIVPCIHFGPARACVLASAGVLRSSGEGVSDPNQDTRFYASLGARAGAELPLGQRFALAAHVDFNATLTRVTLSLDGRDVWKTPPVSAAGGVDFVVKFGSTP
jgi:hypothetical protein